MAHLGIDYGTTNTVVVCADRGRYPLVPHVTDTAIGRVSREVFPSFFVYDISTGCLRFGAEAERSLAEPGAAQRYIPIRSFKRFFRNYVDGMRIATDSIPGGLDMRDTFRQFTQAIYDSVRASGIVGPLEPLEAVLTWPANANGAQRHLTRSAFKEAGFSVISTLNEPSAAAIELADRMVHGNRAKARQLKMTVAVFDLGGGTFDASVVRISTTDYTVLGSAGIENLGGDDFDAVLAELFCEKLKIQLKALTLFQRTMLLMHACREKERLSAGQSRTLTLDPEEIGLSGEPVKVIAATYEKHLAELIEPAVAKLEEVIKTEGNDELETIYLVGGSSRLPLVSKLIARRFPKVKLFTTDKPFSATSMGAAIQSVETMRVHEVFARHFGVIRLADHGTREIFAPVFQAGLRLPARGDAPISAEVRYRPRHNIGRFRYLECTSVDREGKPEAGLRTWSEILFPYDYSLAVNETLTPDQIMPRNDLAGEAVETYSCDSDGIITVQIKRADGQSRTFEVFRS
ncbi:MAG: Hsp70 family protein [bacterium]|jgi:molecular chaperone DnaK (HSP70)